jgi:hypothetical protein
MPTRTFPKRLICFAQGDPHIIPFIGGRFDLHQEGVFLAVKHGDIEVQWYMKTCRGRQRWSGGLSVKCLSQTAMQVAKSVVYVINAAGTLSGARGSQAGFVYSRNGRLRDQRLDNDDWQFRVQRGWANRATNMWITLKNPRFFGRSPGICGGLGERALSKGTGRIRQPGSWRSRAALGYPCKRCKNGSGYVGAICNCFEWGVHKFDQIFIRKITNQFNAKPLAPIDTGALSGAKQKCLSFLKEHPAGALAWKQKSLRGLMNAEADNCALDSNAGLKGKSPRFNRRHTLESFCLTIKSETTRRRDNSVLCGLLSLCKLESEKCGAAPARSRRRRRL